LELVPPQHVPNILWPDYQQGPWIISAGFARLKDGTTACIGMQIRYAPRRPVMKSTVLWDLEDPDAPEPEHAISASSLRGIPFGWIIDRSRESIGDLAPSARVDTVPRRRKRLDDHHYKDVAAIYSDACTSSNSQTRRAPRTEVAEHFHVADSTASKWIRTCRDRGLLPKTTRGRKAGNTD